MTSNLQRRSINDLHHEIVENLRNSKNLSEVFPSILILAKTIKDKELEKWAELEISGYFKGNASLTSEVIVPEYRSVPGQYTDLQNRPLIINDPKLKFVNEYRLRNAISELENLAQKNSMMSIQDSSFIDLIKRKLNATVHYFNFDTVSVIGILQAIRTNAINKLMAIEIDKKYPHHISSKNEVIKEVTNTPAAKIFISHSSKDKILVNQFVEKILILGCGLNDEQIFCTSIEGLGIKTGSDFREHIRQNLKNAKYSFLIISNDYKESEVCINEMGASWAIDDIQVKQFLAPNLNFNSLGVLLNIHQAAKIDNPSDLDELYQELIEAYETKVKTVRWNKHKTDFLNFIQSLKPKEIASTSLPPLDFFSNFIKENISINKLLLEAHPNLLDCKAVFSEKYYKHFYDYYCKFYEKLEKDYVQPLYPKKKFFKVDKTTTSEMMKGINKIAGGMVDAAKKGYFNYDAEFYEITFLTAKDEEMGNSFKVFSYINGRWVFFAKPWQLPIGN